MADMNLKEFYGRVVRIEKDHSRGRGFEAPGALGRSHYTRRRGLRLPLMMPLLFLFCGMILLKASIHYTMGAERYEMKVEQLWTGDTVDRFGAAIMQPEPLTRLVSYYIGDILG